jgi:hypothetical protein
MPNEWSDFPKRKDELGRWLCRKCGVPLAGRKTSWCSHDCLVAVLLLCDWSFFRNKVKRRDKYRCVVCHRNKHEAGRLEVDHIVELTDGGLTVLSNTRTMCRRCHLQKTAEMRRKRAAARRDLVLVTKEAEPEEESTHEQYASPEPEDNTPVNVNHEASPSSSA